MPVITIWHLPAEGDQKLLETLYERCVASTAQIKELGITRGDITILFPLDRMKMGLGNEIIAFVDGLFIKPERSDEVRAALAKALGTGIKDLFPNALVEVFVRPFDPAQGFWTSKKEVNPYRAVRQLERMLGNEAGIGGECLDHRP